MTTKEKTPTTTTTVGVKPRVERPVTRPKTPGTIKIVHRVAAHRPVAKRTTTTPKIPEGVSPKSIKKEQISASEVATSEPNSSLSTGNVVNVSLDELQILGKRRPVDPIKVRILAGSMTSIGLQVPITVRRSQPTGVELVAGLHRVEAAKLLGWISIPGLLMDESQDIARRWQFEENLDRAELIALDYAEHIAGWVKCAHLQPRISGQDDQKVGRPESGIALAARTLPVAGRTGEARRKAVERAMKIDAIADEAKLLARTTGFADNQAALLAIAEEATPEAQLKKVQELASRGRNPRKKKKPIPVVNENTAVGQTEGAPPPECSPSADLGNPEIPDRRDASVVRENEAAYASLIAAWGRASNSVRLKFVEKVVRHFQSQRRSGQ